MGTNASQFGVLARGAGVAALIALAGCAGVGPQQEASVASREPDSSHRPAPGGPAVDTLGLVAYAASMQGKPYVMGGAAPQEGFDCSGLVYHVFRRFNFELPRNAIVMAEQLPPIPLTALQAADLLFFDTQGTRFGHVGIYLGDGRFVHAPSPRTGRVIISSISNAYWSEHLVAARRPLPRPSTGASGIADRAAVERHRLD